MSERVIYVSVNNSYTEGGSMTDLAQAAHGNWPRTLDACREVGILVAVQRGTALGAWEVLGAYPNPDDTYTTPGGERPRIAFSLGESIPLEPKLHDVPKEFRRGCAIADR